MNSFLHIFDFPRYGKHSELEKDIETKITEDLFENLNNIKSVEKINVGSHLLYIKYDEDYFCLTVEPCVFSGYLFPSITAKEYQLQFRLLESQADINLNKEIAKVYVFGKDSYDALISFIKKKFYSYIKIKSDIYTKMQDVEKIISMIHKIKTDDTENILQYSFADIVDNNFFDDTIIKLKDMLQNYYKENRLYSLEGKDSCKDYEKHLSELLDDIECEDEPEEEPKQKKKNETEDDFIL